MSKLFISSWILMILSSLYFVYQNNNGSYLISGMLISTLFPILVMLMYYAYSRRFNRKILFALFALILGKIFLTYLVETRDVFGVIDGEFHILLSSIAVLGAIILEIRGRRKSDHRSREKNAS